MLKENPSAPSSYIPSARSSGPGKRRNFRAADKRRIVEETCREGASVSGVARKYGIGIRLMRARSSLSHKSAACIIATNGSPPNLCGASFLTPSRSAAVVRHIANRYRPGIVRPVEAPFL